MVINTTSTLKKFSNNMSNNNYIYDELKGKFNKTAVKYFWKLCDF